MIRIGIHSRKTERQTIAVLRRLVQTILEKGAVPVVSSYLFKHFSAAEFPVGKIEEFHTHEELYGVEAIVSLGGDGSFLDTITYVRDKNIPIIGINTGRLGFLSDVPVEKAGEAIEALLQKKYQIEERSLLCLDSDVNLFEVNVGLNEFSILKRDSSSMIVVHTYLDGEYLNSYWSDGLIIATPTGSTGYSLSVGGPIVFPASGSFIISPVSPHNLNVRPLVVPDSSVISFEIEGRSRNFLISLDSRSRKVNSQVRLAIRKSDYTVKLVKLPDSNFLNTLRVKLNWGLDMRN